MAPPRNTQRRRALADAAITVLGTAGIHKLSHRAVDEAARLPAGTAANYFPRREDLLTAAAERVTELQTAEMAAADRAAVLAAGSAAAGSAAPAASGAGSAASAAGLAGAPDGAPVGQDGLADLIAASLFDAVTRHRTRYLAAFELALESTRQPALAAAMSELGAAALGITVAEHRLLGLPTTPAQVEALIALYGGTLLTLVVAPPGSVTREGALVLARSIVAGVLTAGPPESFSLSKLCVISSRLDWVECQTRSIASFCQALGARGRGAGGVVSERRPSVSQTDHRGHSDAFEPEDADGLGAGRAGGFGTDVAVAFEQGGPADTLAPGPALAELTEAAVGALPQLSDDQLAGVIRASRRQQNREAWRQALMVAEFARRREGALRAAEEQGAPIHLRPGQFPGEELAMELVLGPVQAAHLIDDSTDLVTRLPATRAGMAAGLIDADRAGIIAFHTRVLSDADAAVADRVLAAVAPSLRLDQLLRRACALEMKLAPEAVRARREHARRNLRRVEVRREQSGNALVAARELDTTDALASKAYIHGLALRLRRAGLPGTLDQLRVLVFTDLTAGRDPLDRLGQSQQRPDPLDRLGQSQQRRDHDVGPSGGQATGSGTGGAASSEPAGTGGASLQPAEAGAVSPEPADASAADLDPADASAASLDDAGDDDAGDWDPGSDSGCGSSGQPPGPVPATINLIVPAGILFGGDSGPAEAGGWGLLDAEETQALVAAASRHPASRWCVTVTGEDGTAVGHGCAPGRHLWPPGRGNPAKDGTRRPPEVGTAGGTGPPGDTPAGRLVRFLRGLHVSFVPVARGSCDHDAAERRYTPSRGLAHLVRARTATCDAPGCQAPAVNADLDHTLPWPAGPTDQCNLGPKCRRHHRVKHARGWKVEQPRPGEIRWTLPSGRIHVTRPTSYDPLAPPEAFARLA